ncbi:hypothetical protein SI65_04798 [Aspergillus cristatus]|uniref:Uncharacterized protein n=1 Tax=Aspergillus cristatus TaxID=573508 RepID=A0A1E3BFS3_ASPCR|nr:hypothetical protein SI65_04798 [Aspergillus cristatus]
MSLDRHGEERTWIGTKKEKDSRPGMNDERVLPVATDQSFAICAPPPPLFPPTTTSYLPVLAADTVLSLHGNDGLSIILSSSLPFLYLPATYLSSGNRLHSFVPSSSSLPRPATSSSPSLLSHSTTSFWTWYDSPAHVKAPRAGPVSDRACWLKTLRPHRLKPSLVTALAGHEHRARHVPDVTTLVYLLFLVFLACTADRPSWLKTIVRTVDGSASSYLPGSDRACWLKTIVHSRALQLSDITSWLKTIVCPQAAQSSNEADWKHPSASPVAYTASDSVRPFRMRSSLTEL